MFAIPCLAGGLKMPDFTKYALDDWRAIAEQEIKGLEFEELVWTTPEGIRVQPLYSKKDVIGLEDQCEGLLQGTLLTNRVLQP